MSGGFFQGQCVWCFYQCVLETLMVSIYDVCWLYIVEGSTQCWMCSSLLDIV